MLVKKSLNIRLRWSNSSGTDLMNKHAKYINQESKDVIRFSSKRSTKLHRWGCLVYPPAPSEPSSSYS